MSKLVYGKDRQVHFDNEAEKKEAIEYILTSPNVNFRIHENNQNQGAWGLKIGFISSVKKVCQIV